MTIQVFRLNASSYQTDNFFNREAAKIDSIPNTQYVYNISEINADSSLILISNTHTDLSKIPPEILDKTIAIIHPNSGYDNFRSDFILEADFPILLGNPVRAHSVTEYILGCIFQHYVKIPNQLHWNESRKWHRRQLKDQKVLIYGQGMIGTITAQTLSGLCQKTFVYDPYKESTILKTSKITSIDESFLETLDIIIFCQSLNSMNKKSFDRKFFDSLKKDVLLVNPARGGLINEKELERFLNNNPKAFAYLDVFEEEPYSPALFSKLKNINKTSHIAGVHENLNDSIIDFEYKMINEIVSYFKQGKMEIFKRDFHQLTALSKIQKGNFI